MTKDWENAVRQGSVEAVQHLFARPEQVNARDAHGQTALMIAASEGHVQLVAWLIQAGADLNQTAKYGLSALMIAVIRNHPDVVELLVDAGANLELRGSGAPGFAGKTALDLATAQENSGIREILRAASESNQ